MCQAYSPNSHLVAIESEAEQSFLRDIWKNKYGISNIFHFSVIITKGISLKINDQIVF